VNREIERSQTGPIMGEAQEAPYNLVFVFTWMSSSTYLTKHHLITI